jgi:hypothetical protein
MVGTVSRERPRLVLETCPNDLWVEINIRLLRIAEDNHQREVARRKISELLGGATYALAYGASDLIQARGADRREAVSQPVGGEFLDFADHLGACDEDAVVGLE